jgi:hypothetical protein
MLERLDVGRIVFRQFRRAQKWDFHTPFLADAGNRDNHVWSGGPGVTWNIFNAGATVSNLKLQKAVQEETLSAYENVVLAALKDVDSALVAYAKEQEHLTALTDAVTNGRKAVELSMQLYSVGRSDYLKSRGDGGMPEDLSSLHQQSLRVNMPYIESSKNVSLIQVAPPALLFLKRIPTVYEIESLALLCQVQDRQV